jgi:hypothetical protein
MKEVFFGLLLVMLSGDILSSSQERIIEQILLLNQQSGQCAVAQTGPSGNAC